VIVRVYAPEATGSGQSLQASAEEARWLRNVLRVGTGESVHVFDGRGREWHGEVTSAARSGVTVRLGAAIVPCEEPRIPCTLAMAVLKGDGSDGVVRDAVMMGVAEIRPFVSARTEVSRAALERGHRRERWERVAVASAKQSGRAVVPLVRDVQSFESMIAGSGGGLRVLLVEPAAGGVATPVADLQRPDAVTLASGPEGGWTPDEVAAASAAGWRLVRLGGRVLRADAAPLVALSACQAVWRDA
jgi:16S rRNA (uracil1498-N3)-methyltransferase